MSQCTFHDQTSEHYRGMTCDMCNYPMDSSMHRTDDGLLLCVDCFWRLEDLEKNTIRDSISRFLTGNVV